MCPVCVAGGHLIMLAVIGKKMYAGQTYYLVKWQGLEEPTWQAYADIPIGSRPLVNDYNRSNTSTRKSTK